MINSGVKCAILMGSVLLPLLGGALAVNSNIWSSSRKPKSATVQYHTQDPISGAYQYGYTGPHHTKSESSVNGVTHGGYSYIDSNGLMQTVSYTADRDNGFRVHASNSPSPNALTSVKDTPEVALAKESHLEQVRKAETSQLWKEVDQEQLQYDPYKEHHSQYQQQQQQQQQSRQSPSSQNPYLPRPEEVQGFSTGSKTMVQHHYLVPVAPTIAYALPLPLIHSSMSHTQDSLGQYEYSYTGDTSAKTESRALDGTTRGAYSYIDANGLLQQVHYIADRNGFRVLATNLPGA